MEKNKVCVYCGGGKVTSEHVFPECFRKTVGEPLFTAKTLDGEKAISSALTVRDVCAQCNNGPLSQLDAYICGLNSRYFERIIHAGDRVRFEYEYDMLLRALLKLSYNVARARKWPLKPWQDTAEYIVGKGASPPWLHIFLQLMIPTPLREAHLPVAEDATEVPPIPMRVALADVRPFHGLMSGCLVSIRSYRFFVVWEDISLSTVIRRKGLDAFFKISKGAYQLTRRGRVVAYASSVKVLDDVTPIFREQVSKLKALKSKIESKNFGHR